MFALGHWSLCFCCFCSKIFLGKSVSWQVVKHVSLEKAHSARSVCIRFGSLKKKSVVCLSFSLLILGLLRL